MTREITRAEAESARVQAMKLLVAAAVEYATRLDRQQEHDDEAFDTLKRAACCYAMAVLQAETEEP